MAQIHELIGKAMAKVGAIGKDSVNEQQKFRYRGIDAVYNALNPVMSELGIFICPEIVDQKREERTTRNGSVLTYTILTIKYTVYAPDGSNVSLTVVGEGMDSGDKSANKAMSVAMKYAMFQLLCIPTEEMVDPDRDVYTDIMPKKVDNPAQVATIAKIPQKFDYRPVFARIKQKLGMTDREFAALRKELIAGGVVEDIPGAELDENGWKRLEEAMIKNKGTSDGISGKIE